MIALGRIMLAVLFLLALLADRSAPTFDLVGAHGLLLLYVVGAVGIAALTWRNWWLDARLAVPMHAFDMAIFTAIVFATNSSTSPYFLFFVLPLLSATIRWGWRATALTAAALIALYFGAGLLLAGRQGLQLDRFVIRSGHLIILSLLLMWFGVHQRMSRLFFRVEDFDAELEQSSGPLARALDLAIRVTRAGGGVLLIAPRGDEASEGLLSTGGEMRTVALSAPLVRGADHPSFLFDVACDRSLARRPQGSFQFEPAAATLRLTEARELGIGAGLAAEVVTGTQHGWLLLWGIPDLSNDFIDLGRELGRATGAIVERHALLQAIEHGTAARTRLGLARDVHDSIVQFLAGAAFRVEAIKRAAGGGRAVGGELEELKRLLVEEQAEIRSFLLALRRDRDLDIAEAVAELRVLAQRLSDQWEIDCQVSAKDTDGAIPIRLQFDLQQMLREAVANAVRHGGARRVDVGLAVEQQRLRLHVVDDGSGFATAPGEATAEPRSLKERVERANGSLSLVSKPGTTDIMITLPLAGAA